MSLFDSGGRTGTAPRSVEIVSGRGRRLLPRSPPLSTPSGRGGTRGRAGRRRRPYALRAPTGSRPRAPGTPRSGHVPRGEARLVDRARRAHGLRPGREPARVPRLSTTVAVRDVGARARSTSRSAREMAKVASATTPRRRGPDAQPLRRHADRPLLDVHASAAHVRSGGRSTPWARPRAGVGGTGGRRTTRTPESAERAHGDLDVRLVCAHKVTATMFVPDRHSRDLAPAARAEFAPARAS